MLRRAGRADVAQRLIVDTASALQPELRRDRDTATRLIGEAVDARTPQSQHDPAEFIVGNILDDPDIDHRLDTYNTSRLRMGGNATCRSCGIAGSCGKGCPAAVIAAGQLIGAIDAEVCPITSADRRLLPLMPV